MTKTRSALVALGLVMLLMLVLVPAATAASGRTAVAGTWSWEGVAEVRDLPSGGQIINGQEDGVWTGSFSGDSFDTFKAVFQPNGENGGFVVGTLWANFVGAVNGVNGKLLIRVNYADRNAGFMDGHWSIVKGWDGLEGVSGQGTWIIHYGTDWVDEAADYIGVVKMR
jgi:hypothetical protein